MISQTLNKTFLRIICFDIDFLDVTTDKQSQNLFYFMVLFVS